MISHIGRGGGGLVPLHHVVDPLLRPQSPPTSARYLVRFATQNYPFVLTPVGVFTSVATPAEYCDVSTSLVTLCALDLIAVSSAQYARWQVGKPQRPEVFLPCTA
jgi:hypothetical protein